MKKILVSLICSVSLLAVSAQTKVTKSNIVGKWGITAVEMKGVVFYDVEKDSLALGDMVKASATDPSQLEMAEKMMKAQFAAFAKLVFQFNADGTALMTDESGEAKPASYEVDEANSTVTTTEKGKNEKTTVKASLISADKLQLVTSQPQGDVYMTLKKK